MLAHSLVDLDFEATKSYLPPQSKVKLKLEINITLRSNCILFVTRLYSPPSKASKPAAFDERSVFVACFKAIRKRCFLGQGITAPLSLRGLAAGVLPLWPLSAV